MSQPAAASIPRVIAASAIGTMIEWYDFYIFGSLATVIVVMTYLYASVIVFPTGVQLDTLVRTGIARGDAA